MDGKVRYASDSCLAESPAGGRISSLGMSHRPMGTVPLLCLRLAKTPKTRSLARNAERVAPAIPLSHIPFRCFAISQGDLLLSRGWGFQVGHAERLKEAGDRSLRANTGSSAFADDDIVDVKAGVAFVPGYRFGHRHRRCSPSPFSRDCRLPP